MFKQMLEMCYTVKNFRKGKINLLLALAVGWRINMQSRGV